MLHSQGTASEKRTRLRWMLDAGALVRMPGAFNPLVARSIEHKGFEGVYVSGAVMSAELGLPDIGLTTLTEVSQRSGQIARATELPALVDADTGFGSPVNVARTVQVMEDAGVAGIHIEDQVNPKRCGHLEGKAVVDDETARQRIRAAVEARRDDTFLIMARTDVRGIEGLDPAIERMKSLVDTGADAVFPEALTSLEEYEAVRRAVDVPVLANMTEFGKTALFTTTQLHSAGVNIVIFPVTLLRLAMGAVEQGLDTLLSDGTLAARVADMQTRARLYELVDYQSYAAFDDGIHTFSLRAEAHGDDEDRS